MQATEFEVNLYVVLAHTIVYESKQEWPGCESARCGGDPPAASPTESMASILSAYNEYLPKLSQTAIGILPSWNQAQLESMRQTSDPQTALQTELYRKYGPELNKIGTDIAGQNALAQAANDARLLSSPEMRSALESSLGLSRLADPEYYATRELAGQKTQDLLRSIDPNRLTGSESAEIERNLNRMNSAGGVSGATSPTAGLANALEFGNALNNKKTMLSNAINTATSFLPTARSGVFEGTTGKGQLPNTGENKFMGVDQQAGKAGMDFGNQILQGTFGLAQQQNDINSQRRDSLDRVTGVLGSLPSIS